MSQHATAVDYNRFWTLNLNITGDAVLLAQLNHILTAASSVVDANVSAAGPASLWSSSAWGTDFLRTLTTIYAGVAYTLEYGPQLTAEMKRMWLDWLDSQYELIRSGEIDPAGGTGAGVPAWGTVEYNLTPWNGATIAMNQIMRGAG